MIIFVTLVLAAGMLAFDIVTPLGVGEWGMYIVPLLFTIRARQRWYPYVFAGICTVMVILGVFCSAPGINSTVAMLNRGVGIAVLWITAVLLVKRRQVEEALQSSEGRLRAILDHSPVGIFAKDLAGRYVEFNRQCEKFNKKTRESVLGKTDHEFFPKELADIFTQTDKEVLEGGKVVRRENHFLFEGEERIRLAIKFPILDKRGKYTAICGFSTDITDLKRAEQALRQNQERLDLAQEAGRIGTFDWNVATGEAFRSPTMDKLYGLPPGQFEPTYEAWRERTHPEDRLRIEMEIQKAITERQPLDHEFRIIWPDGSVHWLRNVGRIFCNEAGEAQRMIGVNIDITEPKRIEQELKQSEERFRVISDQALMGIYIIQAERFSYVNPKFAEMFGYTQAEMVALPSMLNIVTEEDRDRAGANLRRRLSGEIKPVPYQFHGRKKDGEMIMVEVHGIPTQLNGKAIVIGTIQDVTERERSEAALKQTTEQLQTLSRRLLELQEAERRHIARELHDEIGQALTALKINLQAVQRLSGMATLAPRLTDSISIVDRTLRQVRNLSLDLRPSMLDDLGLCSALRWYADQQAQRAGLSIQFMAGELGARLEPALETACFRVAQEALTNIVRHAQATTVRVHLESDGDSLHLTVHDDGIGFDPEHLEQQTERGRSLGLLGMKERASLIGGRVELKSAPRAGTEVHAWFPITNARMESSAETELVEQ
ncbi:MAG: Multi-sensor signal transduction histidine kinase [Pedosphaera sp.]|nr:Multi-sensor signal transduction histidine kinase [Pedosphaera sp.]